MSCTGAEASAPPPNTISCWGGGGGEGRGLGLHHMNLGRTHSVHRRPLFFPGSVPSARVLSALSGFSWFTGNTCYFCFPCWWEAMGDLFFNGDGLRGRGKAGGCCGHVQCRFYGHQQVSRMVHLSVSTSVQPHGHCPGGLDGFYWPQPRLSPQTHLLCGIQRHLSKRQI